MKNPDRFYVYCYAEPGKDHPFYIGKGSGERAYDHLRPSNLKRRSRMATKLRGMLRDGISAAIEFLHVSLAEPDAFALERVLIAKWGRLDLGSGCLCNHTDGGEGGSNTSQETRQRLSAAAKGRPKSPDAIRRSAESRRGQKRSPEQCKRNSAAQQGKTLSAETRVKMSAARTGLKASPETLKKLSDSRRQLKGRGVQSTNPATGEIKSYPIVRAVAADGFLPGNVCCCCNGKRKTHGGLIWRYVEQPTGTDDRGTRRLGPGPEVCDDVFPVGSAVPRDG
jgi:hypothetical protein